MSRTKQFVYRPRTGEQVRRRLAIYGWAKGLYQAYKYNTKALCNYLRSPELPLDDEKRNELADLIGHHIQPKQGKGRKRGIIPSDPDTKKTRDVVAHARVQLRWIKAGNGGKAPRGSYKQILEEACNFFADEGYDVDCDLDKALDDLRRGRPARVSRKS
jgi:hypothetical protein